MKYKLSKFIMTNDSQSEIIQNTKTGERMSVSEETLKLIKFFEKPISFEDVLSCFSVNKKEKLEILNFLKQLLEEKILVPTERTKEKYGVPVLADKVLVESPTKTFFSCPQRNPFSIKDEDIIFLGIPFDLGTTGYPGTRFGPDKIREISADAFEYQADIFTGKSKGWFSLKKGKTILKNVKMADIGNVLLQVGENFEKFYNRITKIISMVIANRNFPVIVGGDHSCSYPVLRAINKQYGKEVSVIHIDAHTDCGEIIPRVANNHGNVFTKVRKEKLIHHLYQFGAHGHLDKKIIDSNYFLFSLETLNEMELRRRLIRSSKIDCII